VGCRPTRTSGSLERFQKLFITPTKVSKMRFILALMIAVTCVHARAADEEPKGARGAGYTFAKTVIKPTLKNPSSADFDWESVKVDGTFKGKKKDDGTSSEIVSVSGVVRATNSFNAVVPSKWQVVMTHGDEGWKPIVVTHESEFLLKTDEGEQFLNALVERSKKKKAEAAAKNDEIIAQQKREKEELVAQQKRESQLQACYEAGQACGEEVAERFGRNVKKTPDSLVEKHAAKALKAAGYSDEEESDKFRQGFRDAIAEAKKE